MSKLLTWIKQPIIFFLTLNNHGLLGWIDDKTMLKVVYKYQTGKKLNLDNPSTFNEKIQWLKLNYHNPLFTTLVDKYAVKNYIKGKIGEEYIIPTLGCWDKPSQIEYDKLPERFVLKTNHDSGGVVVCKNKSEINKKEIERILNKHLRRSGYNVGREWPYKNVKRKIFAEQFLENPGDRDLVVYKVLCFNGEPKILQVIQNDKTPEETIDYFDCDWNLLDLKQNHPNSKTHLAKPELLEKMLEMSKQVMIDTPLIRIDWYVVGDRLYFSEFTFYSDNGFATFQPASWDEKLGEMIDLSRVPSGFNT